VNSLEWKEAMTRALGRGWFGSVLVGVSLSLCVGSVFGQESPDSIVGGRFAVSDVRLPHLGDHIFSPNGSVPDPFITTYVRNTLGIGKALDIKTPIIVIDDEEILGLRGDILVAFLDFEYQQRIKSWIAVRAHLNVVGRLGTDVQAFLADGVTAVSGFELGWLLKIYRSERIMLSGDLMVANRPFTSVNVLGFVEDIVDGVPPRLTTTTPAVRTGGGLRFAWAASRFFGVTAASALGYAESVGDRSTDRAFFKFGTTMDVDIRSKTPVPLGVSLGYRLDTVPEGGEDVGSSTHGGILRISYNGRPDFSLGLELSTERVESSTFSEPFTIGSTLIDFRYYF
jgi:hypothetical protein